MQTKKHFCLYKKTSVKNAGLFMCYKPAGKRLLNQSHDAVKAFTTTAITAESKQAGEKLPAEIAVYIEAIEQTFALKQAAICRRVKL